MNRSWLLALILLFLAAALCFASDDDGSFSKTIYEEGFEGSFPPAGWTLEFTGDDTWRRVTPGSGDGWDAHEGIRSACVGGDGSGVLDEGLITGRIDIGAESVGFDATELSFSFSAYAEDTGSLNQLTVQASTDPPDEENWLPVNRKYDFDFDEEGDWVYADVNIQPYLSESAIWLMFRYTGREMVCLDGIYIRLQGDFEDGEGCGGCGLAGERSDTPLTMIMVLVGLVCLAVARRRK